ncbi:MAG: hypothetical protein E7390_01160 [Ruminococcaceae bacterium]|nr:hypothetical protein [Oscillospiraceae bacterium]
MVKTRTKLLAMTVCLGLVLGVCGILAVSAADANLLLNGSFEGDLTGWTPNGVSDLSAVLKADGGADGSGYLCFDAATANGVYRPGVRYYVGEELEAGATYTVTFSYIATSGSNPVWFRTYFAGEAYSDNDRRGSASSEWKTLTENFTVPETYDKTSTNNFLQIYCNETVGEELTFKLDSVAVTKNVTSVPVAGSNLINNGDFENESAGYGWYTGTTDFDFTEQISDYTDDTAKKRLDQSTHFAFPASAASATNICQSLKNRLKADTTYILAFDCYVPENKALAVDIILLDGDTATTDTYPQFALGYTSSAWRHREFAFTTPEAFDTTNFPYIRFKKNVSSAVEIRLDNVELREMVGEAYISFGVQEAITNISGYVIKNLALTNLNVVGGDIYSATGDELRSVVYTKVNIPIFYFGIYETVNGEKKLAHFYPYYFDGSHGSVKDLSAEADAFYLRPQNAATRVPDGDALVADGCIKPATTYEVKAFLWDSALGMKSLGKTAACTFTSKAS